MVNGSTTREKRGQFTALAVLCLICGLLLTMDNIGILTGVWRLWPIFPFFLGLGAIWMFKKNPKKDLKPLGIGTFLILISIFFLILNYTSWRVMAKAWPTFIGVLGISILSISYFSDKRKWFAISGLFFIFLAAIFFMVFTIDSSLWPISLMLFGIWLLLIPKPSGKKSLPPHLASPPGDCAAIIFSPPLTGGDQGEGE